MDAAHLVKDLWPYAVVGAPGVWAMVKTWGVSVEAKRKDRRDLIQIAQDAAGAVIDELREETDRLRDHVRQLEAELNQLRRDHADMQAQKDAKITLLEGEIRHLEQYTHSLEDLLRRHGIPKPVRGQPYWEVRPDENFAPHLAPAPLRENEAPP